GGGGVQAGDRAAAIAPSGGDAGAEELGMGAGPGLALELEPPRITRGGAKEKAGTADGPGRGQGAAAAKLEQLDTEHLHSQKLRAMVQPPVLLHSPPGGPAVATVQVDVGLRPERVTMLDVEPAVRPAAHHGGELVACALGIVGGESQKRHEERVQRR